MSEPGITPAPLLDSPRELDGPGYPLSRGGRVLLGLWTLGLLAGFWLASRLDPDPRGYGTHQRLGLPPCSFQLLCGLKCPSCGSTTCFAHYVRGDWSAAIRSNPGAFGLAIVCTAMIPWGAWSVWTGRLWRLDEPATAFLWLLVSIVTISIVQWIVRMVVE
jgi:hypothetical protein